MAVRHDEAAMTVLRGTVASGKSDLAHWMRTYAAAYSEATGLALHAGSLNVVLAAPYELPDDRIRLSASAVGVTSTWSSAARSDAESSSSEPTPTMRRVRTSAV